jgi:hypothetical protein
VGNTPTIVNGSPSSYHLPEDVRATTEESLPGAVAQHGHSRSAGLVLLGREAAPDDGRQAQHVREVVAGTYRGDALRQPSAGQVEIAVRKGGHAFEAPVLAAPCAEVRIGDAGVTGCQRGAVSRDQPAVRFPNGRPEMTPLTMLNGHVAGDARLRIRTAGTTTRGSGQLATSEAKVFIVHCPGSERVAGIGVQPIEAGMPNDGQIAWRATTAPAQPVEACKRRAAVLPSPNAERESTAAAVTGIFNKRRAQLRSVMIRYRAAVLKRTSVESGRSDGCDSIAFRDSD